MTDEAASRTRWPFATRLGVAFAAVGLAAAGLTALLVNVAFTDRFEHYLAQSQQQRQEQVADALAGSYVQAGGWDPAALDGLASALLMDGGVAEVVDAAGETVWTGEGGPHADLHREMMGTGPLGPEESIAVVVAGEQVGTATLQLPEPGLLPQDVAFRRSVNQLLVIAGLVAAGVALLVGLGISRRATSPARELTGAAQALAAGDRSRRLRTERADEFGKMAEAFNRMADELEAEDELRRGFAADVAHELRTPLMILRGEIEALEDGIATATPAALASLREETLRIARLVDDLETLASADAAGFSLAPEPTDVGAVVHEAAEGLAGVAEERAVRITVDAPPGLFVDADPARLRQVVGNLLANAVKFTPKGGAVRAVARLDGEAVIEVVDCGPGIPDDELPRVFDRFFRGRAAAPGGSGIGLTVVQQLVEAHGGAVTAANHHNGGAAFCVRLPLLRATARS